jgi:membrane associated rhomboid family serine protease
MFKNEINKLKLIITIILIFLVIIWSIWLIDNIFLHRFSNSFGVHPRSVSGLMGIITSPFLHGDFNHILNNSLGFILFAFLILLRDIKSFFIVSIIAMLFSGLGIWLIGGYHTNHIGASGLIFGYFGYCFSIGFFEKKFTTVLFSALIIIGYGSLFFGILPINQGVSWEGHLFGLMGGIFSAYFLAKTRYIQKQEEK